MTDIFGATPSSDTSLSDWKALADVHARLEAELFILNKATLFDALAAASVTLVVVTFDGCGDSGQIEDVKVKAGNKDIDMPAAAIEITEAIWGEPEPRRSSVTIATAIENLVYDVLGMTHDGWENGDGAYGDVTFDVAGHAITLDHNDRYTAIENYTHTF